MFLVLLVIVAIFAGFFAPYPPNELNLSAIYHHPFTPGHLLGTDQVGRDVLSRLIFGARSSLLGSLEAVAIATGVGLPLGLIAGYFGKWGDSFLSWVNDALTSVPALMLALAIVAVLGPGLVNAMFAVGLIFIPRTFRVVRAETLDVCGQPFIEAESSLGAKNSRIIFGHVLPNILSPLLVIISVSLAQAVIAEASLSYLGLGAKPPTASWGAMLADASIRPDLKYLVYAPGLAIAFTVLSLMVISDALRVAISGGRGGDDVV
jgi:peptide/nickel transport system permease protein